MTLISGTALHCNPMEPVEGFPPGWSWRRAITAHIDVFYQGPGFCRPIRSMKKLRAALGSKVDFSSFDLLQRMRMWVHSPMATNSYMALEVLCEEERKLQFDSYERHCIDLQLNGDCRGISPRLVLKEFCAAHPWCPPGAY